MSSEPAVIREGWLLKPPGQLRNLLPRASWNRRYFVLSCPNGGQPRLDYYQDETKKKRKRTIDLDQCLQVDSYLTYEVHKNKTHQWIFDLKLQNSRKQCFLMADNEREMNDWVHDLCRVCNLEREEHSDGTGMLFFPPPSNIRMLLLLLFRRFRHPPDPRYDPGDLERAAES